MSVESLASRIAGAAAAGYVVIFEMERVGRWTCALVDGPKGRLRGSGDSPHDALKAALIEVKMATAPRPSRTRHDYLARQAALERE